MDQFSIQSDTNGYKAKSPSYSLATRYNVPSDVAMKPGPGAYMPEKVTLLVPVSFVLMYTYIFIEIIDDFLQTNQKANQPQYSFGVKHSMYMHGARPEPGEETRPLPY